jgi:uncharacterized SAM-binding protein YcdF (DUF218 family)
LGIFAIVKILSQIAVPPASLGVAVVVGLLLLLVRWRRLGIFVIALGVFETLLFSFPPFGDAAIRYLQDQAYALEHDTPRCCFYAIVVLGGGVAPAVLPERPLPSLTESADRVWTAARLYKAGVAPRIIVSGGGFLAETNNAATTEAEAMRRFLLDLGVPDEAIVDEAKSDNTIENIRNVKAMVGDQPVALITSAFHMPRAMLIARRAKLNASAFATNFRGFPDTRPGWENWLPTMDALGESVAALHELMAIVFDHRGETSP